MIKKIKYKIWKHLTKSLVPDGIIKKTVLESTYEYVKEGRKQVSPAALPQETAPCVEMSVENFPKPIEDEKGNAFHLPKIVAIQGIFFSGSSTLVGMFNEFDNMRVVGSPEIAWTKNSSKAEMPSECCFFHASGFVEMVQSFKKEPPEVVSHRIRKFILSVNNAYRNKRIATENLPSLYNDTFKEITQDLLLKILDLDDHTREFMKTREFPHNAVDARNDATYDSCNFTIGEGKSRYIFYKFADVSEETFHRAIAGYLAQFFSIIDGKEYIVYDQLLPRKTMEVVNRYLSTPIKQIVVYRDPRDQFLAADRRDVAWLPRTAYGLKGHNKRKLNDFSPDDPNRLILRFEDLVLNYDVTRQKIMDFLGLKPENHVAPKSMFDPAISVANIGDYKRYHRQEFMCEIEKELSEYCFYPEKENLSDEAIQLLISSGNWNDVLGIANN